MAHLWGQKMNVKRFVSVAVLAATCGFSFGALNAQTLTRDKGPAELPPSSFTANQYVDSKGCVYIRAGVDGNVNWVPRVSRSREVVCGQTPSLGGSRTATAAPAPAAPVQIVPTAPVAQATPAAPAPAPTRTTPNTVRGAVANALAPRPVRTVASTPLVKQRIAPSMQTARAPRPSTFQQAAPRIQAAPTVAPQRRIQTQPRIVRVAPNSQPQRIVPNTRRVGVGVGPCSHISGINQRYLNRTNGNVLCGSPQIARNAVRAGTVSGGTFHSVNGKVMSGASVSPNAIVVPRHVYDQQQAARLSLGTPKGFRDAWQDDRLNPNRAHQTLGGKSQMDLVWTQTVPRRLVVRHSGRDVTRSFPGLRYPYTSVAQQNAAWSQGQHVVSTQGQAPRRVQKQQVVRQPAARVSTRTSAPRKPAAAAGNRFVQVGTFGVASNAQNTAARIQRMGLPVRIGKFSRGGKQMRIVLAGPFASPAHVNGALRAVQNAGFRDAFARK